MTTQQVLDASRNNLNALLDTNWTDSELLVSLWQVNLYISRETRCIEGTDSSTTTVVGTADYTKPTRSIEIWRMTYNGQKLQKIDLRDQDSMSPYSLQTSGTPAFYTFFNDTISLFPVPADTKTLKIWSYYEATTPVVGVALDIPTVYHDVSVDGLTFKMCPKDLGHPLTQMWESRFESGVVKMKENIRRRRRGDRFAVVKSERNLLDTDFGLI